MLMVNEKVLRVAVVIMMITTVIGAISVAKAVDALENHVKTCQCVKVNNSK